MMIIVCTGWKLFLYFLRHVSVSVQPAEHGELLRAAAARSCADEPAPRTHLPVRVAARPPLLPPAAAPASAAAAAAGAATSPAQVGQHQRQDLLLGCQVQQYSGTRYRGISVHFGTEHCGTGSLQ
jgi:hypothetical protein